MKVCVTGATGFVGGHVARLLSQRGDEVRATYRDAARLERLREVQLSPVKADVLDRAALRRAFRACDVVFHCAGLVGSRPARRVFEVNALSPRVALEAAAAAGVPRVVITSSVGGIGPVPAGEVGDESYVYRTGGLGLTYPDAKHEGESQALAAGARLGVEVVVANPSYVLGVPVDRTQPGETSTRTVGNYLCGRLPAIVEGGTNIVDVEDVAEGHLRAAERGRPGERYVLGGHNVTWTAVIDRIAELSGVRRPIAVIQPELAGVARAAEAVGLGVPGFALGEALSLMSQNWQFSSRKAERELGYRARPLDETLGATIDWYRGLIDEGRLDDSRSVAPLAVAAAGMRVARRLRLLDALRRAEPHVGRRLVAGA